MDIKDLKKYHYENTSLHVTNIARREISLGLNIRRQAFTSTSDLAKVLSARSNMEGAFASTAYYLDPQVKAHTKKGHLGTDLVFDIDIKPVGSRMDWMYEVCRRTSDIIEILSQELGFEKDSMVLDFSGSKGFHITIDKEEYIGLSKTHRSQLVNYLAGDKVVRKDITFGKGGWNKRFAQYITNITKLMGPESKANKELLLQLGLPKTTAKKLGDLLKAPTKRETLSKGRLDLLDNKVIRSLRANFYDSQKKKHDMLDKVVTTDMYRILRIPGTIHPKTGLVSTILNIEDINDPHTIFNKIKEAGGTDNVTIVLEEEAFEDFDQIRLWSAGTHEVPRWLALHLLHQ